MTLESWMHGVQQRFGTMAPAYTFPGLGAYGAPRDVSSYVSASQPYYSMRVSLQHCREWRLLHACTLSHCMFRLEVLVA